jgi:hypothetical protein
MPPAGVLCMHASHVCMSYHHAVGMPHGAVTRHKSLGMRRAGDLSMAEGQQHGTFKQDGVYDA